MGEVRAIAGGAMVDPHAETAVLGELLVSDGHPLDCRDEVTEILRDSGPEVFHDPLNRKVYEAFLSCFIDGGHTDPVTVVGALRQEGELTAELFDHVHGLPSKAGNLAASHGGARTLLDLYRRRLLHKVLVESSGRVQAGGGSYGEIAGEVSVVVSEVIDASTKVETTFSASQVSEAALGHILHGRTMEKGIPMGLHDIDELTGGMRLGQFIVIAGRPGHGKTTVGAQVARNVAHQGIATEIFSLEMPKEELGQRNASAETGIPFEDIRDGRVDAEAIERLIEYDASQANYPMTVDDDPGQTLGEIALKVRKSAREKGAKVFVIDYLQLVKPDKPTGNPTVDVAIVSEGLRRLARTLRVIIIALAQLNRESAGRDDGKPKLTDLRQSGQIEQDANVVILVHLPFKIDPDTARGKEADLILAKNRGGKTAERVMLFDGAHSRFLNPSDVQPRFAA